MTLAEQLGNFAARASWDDVSDGAREQLKIRVLDSLGCALGALGAPPMRSVRRAVGELSDGGPCTLAGGGRAPPDRAALFNGALVRYLDFNDSYLAPGETCHPSDNLAPVLAAAELRCAKGRELLAALAVAYQVQCRLSDVAPVRRAGFDHATHGAVAVAAGVSRALGLDTMRTAHAVAMCTTSLNALRVARTGRLSNWKGLAFPFAASCAVQAVFLARHGATGPLEAFEGRKGFMESVSGPFELDWSRESLESVRRTSLRRYNAEIHSQSCVDALLELRRREALDPARVERLEVEVFDVAWNAIGGGDGGAKKTVTTREDADHSLPYILAVALLDGQLLPEQYAPARIARADVQGLLRRVWVREAPELSARFPEKLPCRVHVTLKGGRELHVERDDYPGYRTRPMTWEEALAKFEHLSEKAAPAPHRAALARTVADLDQVPVTELTALLAAAHAPAQEP